jgi:4-hydroxybenzoate polyprenyltransferase
MALEQVESAAVKPPLAVDLDGTLIHGDIFIEAILRFLRSQPLGAFVLIGWLMKGRAYTKARLAETAPCDPAQLPYNDALVEWLRCEHAAGRTLALATASDRHEAERVAGYVGVFDAVFASDGKTNLKSSRKGERLAQAYPQGFVYAGNERADLRVWRRAQGAVLVNASAALGARAARECAVEKTIPSPHDRARAFMRALRPEQCAKNLLVFLPIVAGQGWLNAPAWSNALLAFLSLCCAASSVYLINDAADIDTDRRHHRKRSRPFASGALSPYIGLPAALALLLAGLALAAAAGALVYVALYVLVSTLYTFWLKTKRLADVFALSGLYVVRVIFGGAASGYFASTWLLAFCGFFFFSLVLCKRVTEIETAAAGAGADLSRRGYQVSDSGILKIMGVAAGFIACLILALYIQDDVAVEGRYLWPDALWTLPAAAAYWLCRVWLLTDRGDMHDDPLIFALRDRTSWLVALAAMAGFAAASFLSV